MKRLTAIAVLIAALLIAAPAGATTRHHLSKRAARVAALHFVTPFVDLLDVNRTVRPRMVQPYRCRRISRVTVRCRFSARVVGKRYAIRSWVRVHRQRDGLLGFLTPLDVLGDGV